MCSSTRSSSFRSRARGTAACLVAVALFGGCGIAAKIENDDTDGWARGVVEAGGYVYLADGLSGLKIYDVTVGKPGLTGSLDLPGLNTRVAVDGKLAWLNDLDNDVVYALDVSDPLAPKQKAKWTAPGTVTAIEAAGGVAYLAVPEGKDGATSGLYAVKLSGNAVQQLGSVAIAGLADIALTSGHVWIVDSTQLLAYARSSSQLATTPVASLTIDPTESLQSLDSGAEPWLVALGKSLWVIDGSNPKAPKTVDHQVITGAAKQRFVAASNVITIVWTGAPFKIYLLVPVVLKGFNVAYSTGAEYGRGLVSGGTGDILRLNLVYDVDKQSKGKARLYEITFRSPIEVPWNQGGTAVYGGLDNYGLAWEFWTPTAQTPSP